MNRLIIVLLSLPFLIQTQTKSDDFSNFRSQFLTDSTYQKNHINFPLFHLVYNVQKEKLDTTYIFKDKWMFTDFGFYKLDYSVQTYDNFDRKLRSTNERVISYEGTENGINYSLYFQRRQKEWFLIKIIDLSD